jgi:hypothetical protein
MVNMNEVRRDYSRYAKAWGIDNELPLGTVPMHDGRPHLEFYPDGRAAYVTTDKGVETSRKETNDVDELLFWIFEEPAYARAWEYEKQHRNPDADSRRIAFPKALEEIGKLSTAWRDRMAAEQEEILRHNPFYDIQ